MILSRTPTRTRTRSAFAAALLLAAAGLSAAAVPAGAAAAAPGPYSYGVAVAPPTPAKSANRSAYESSVEPSIGAEWKSGLTAYQADLGTYFVRFDDSTRPARATWTERSPGSSATTLDPILYTDNAGTPAVPTSSRTIVSQLSGPTSLSSVTDDAGATYTPSTGGNSSGVDHQGIGGGPYVTGSAFALAGTYPASGPKRAIYYCSQQIIGSFCTRSDNGGILYGDPVVAYTASSGATDGCQGLHGHPRVRPDGVLLLPNKNCGKVPGSLPGAVGNHQAVNTNTDSNATPAGWSIDIIPDSTNGITDPSVAADAANTEYFGYGNGDGHPKVAVKTKNGSWSASVDLGALVPGAPVVQTVFPDVVTGSAGRAAVAFLGSTTPTTTTTTGAKITGVDTGFQGIWQVYIARTSDSGATWSVQQVTTDTAFPVQKGCLQLGGTCRHRNLYDFNDITVDQLGRVEYGFADGCFKQSDGSTKGCSDGSGAAGSANDPADGTHVGSIARQDCGPSLFAEQDAALAAVCASAQSTDPSASLPEAPSLPLLAGAGALAGAAMLTLRRRRRA